MKNNDDLFFDKIEHNLKSKEKHAFSDQELLEYLSKWVHFNKKDEDWQSFILSRFGSLPAILAATSDELQKGLNLTEKDSANIKLCYEISLRLLKAKIYNCNIL